MLENKKSLYPLKFIPIVHEKIWGGDKLQTRYQKDPNGQSNIGESWELSGYPSAPSVVANGYLAGKSLIELVDTYKEKIVGKNVYEKYNNNFPLLFKLIDANEDLSIQVHPNDEVANQRHQSFGKTEMWYVLYAEPSSYLTVGFDQETNKQTYLQALKNGAVDKLLKKIKVEAGDVFFIPAGLVHAIGKGVMVAEIQESSDITYRIYDYNRKDSQGRERELHTAQALDVINFSTSEEAKINYSKKTNESITLVHCNHFKTNLLSIDQPKEYTNITNDSFTVYMCIEGAMEIWGGMGSVMVNKGETVMIPAGLESYKIKPLQTTNLLEVTIPNN